MHSLVSNVGRVRKSVVGAISLTEMLLLVSNEMLSTSNDIGALDAFDGAGHRDTSQDGIRAEPLPVAASGGNAANGAGDGAQLNVDAFVAMLGTHAVTTGLHEFGVPGGGDIDTSGESRVEVGC